MIEIQGKYNKAIVFTDVIEETAKQQVYDLCNQEFLENAKIRMMPDLHAGKGCTIGTTMTITDKIVPNFVGVDLGCGMICVQLDVKKEQIDFKNLDQVIRKNIPNGMNVRQKAHINASEIPFSEVLAPINEGRARVSVGTLGGGNHFIEMNESKDGSVYLVIHSGSRNLGKQISEHYQRVAVESLLDNRSEVNRRIAELKAANKHDEISNTIREIQSQRPSISKDMAYVEGENMENYLHDVHIAQKFAAMNRQTMAEVICREMDWDTLSIFDTIHNYVDIENMILRKGAISAQAGEIVIIPMNMRDGSLICRGKGNPEWNYSGPHGAGRIMSRTQAKREVDITEFEDTMKNVWSTSVTKSTVDESPFAYKKMEDILKHIGETVDVLDIIKPLYNFKAS
ncbi:RtcB family protein [Sporosarcina sp. G11-34]|uniref:RtcB family protein n=1 Tax=Sporosarcina sp. G11-34 TaxID=2849605 RepID=UPI0022A8E8FB|nr:RtcB family protein [Sporosarcina sp. G11-34]MCZ2257926.1 RtcB family protein [Sporosarcina sp. G11-34]